MTPRVLRGNVLRLHGQDSNISSADDVRQAAVPSTTHPVNSDNVDEQRLSKAAVKG